MKKIDFFYKYYGAMHLKSIFSSVFYKGCGATHLKMRIMIRFLQKVVVLRTEFIVGKGWDLKPSNRSGLNTSIIV
jgi:hypothetical protein